MGATLVASAELCGAHGGPIDSEIQDRAPPLARRDVAGNIVDGVTKVRCDRLTGALGARGVGHGGALPFLERERVVGR